MVIIIPADPKFRARQSTGTVKKRSSAWHCGGFRENFVSDNFPKNGDQNLGVVCRVLPTSNSSFNHSMLQLSFASWHIAVGSTSIAKTWLHNNAVGS